jgi:hypothetical protein
MSGVIKILRDLFASAGIAGKNAITARLPLGCFDMILFGMCGKHKKLLISNISNDIVS